MGCERVDETTVEEEVSTGRRGGGESKSPVFVRKPVAFAVREKDSEG